jgi:hypothetical protein
MVIIKLQDLVESFEMSCYVARKYKHKSCQRALINKVDQDNPRKVPLTGTERAKVFGDCWRAERERTCQHNTSNTATVADSLMALQVKMRSSNADVEKPTGLMGF